MITKGESEMKEATKMTRARADLVISNPFFGVLALRMRMLIDNDIPTACTDGVTIRYNEEFVDSLSHPEVKGLLAHELLHCALLHQSRRGSREPMKANVAMDYAINPICVDSGFTLPANALIEQKFKDKTFEEIYTLLPDLPTWAMSCGMVSDGTPESEGEWKIAVAQAAHVARQAGKLPQSLERFIDEIISPQIPWRDVLRRFITEKSTDDYSWSRPNRRHIAAGLYLPTAWSENMGPIVIGVDTSGSIGQSELNVFGSEINAIIQDAAPSKTYVVYCDARVNHVDVFEKGDEVVLSPHGGGGTDFSPVFDWVEKEGIQPKCLVYLTDLYGSFPEEPSFPTLWACVTELEAPFGETLRIVL
jgi:predicted metal-dependent peptidase